MGSRRLVLIRHAKAADGPVDAQRRLADRGRADAPAIGRWLAGEDVAPDRVVVSPARRAVQTWELAAGELGDVASPLLDERMFDNTIDALLDVIRDTPESVGVLVLVGHNPSVQELARYLDDGHAESAARQEMVRNYPTSGVAVLELNTPWAQVGAAAGKLVDFAIPRG